MCLHVNSDIHTQFLAILWIQNNIWLLGYMSQEKLSASKYLYHDVSFSSSNYARRSLAPFPPSQPKPLLSCCLLSHLSRLLAMALSLPRTLGELQLYRVLQRANLLSYYETFIQQGGDDVQQLCEAGEEEFLEIMALVGMATKPLHVRRLQKALREWATNPGLFNQPVPSIPVSSIPLFKISESGGRKSLTNGHTSPGDTPGKASSTSPAKSPSETTEKLSPLPGIQWGTTESEEEGGVSSPSEHPTSTERLDSELVQAVSDCVERLLHSCSRSSDTDLRALMKLNKKLAKTVGHIFRMDNGDPRKEEEIRRHSAIYGRGDARRCEGKQLTLHEVSQGKGFVRES